MKKIKLLFGLVICFAFLAMSGCSDEASNLEGWWQTSQENYDGYRYRYFIHIKGKTFSFYGGSSPQLNSTDREIPGMSGWYYQYSDNCLFYVEGDYIILDNGKKAYIDGNKIVYKNYDFEKK